ncbi:MAG TPA: hypothetical protein VFW30_00900 [Bryocella sp.]|nr:hypothetical protein [Bryocella sp.]
MERTTATFRNEGKGVLRPSQQLWIENRAIGAHPLTAPASDKVFAVLVAYLDDSGTHDGSPNSVFGGYWGSMNEWRRFERAWKPILAGERIQEFHAKQFWPRIPGKGRIGPYRDWSDERHATFIDRLLRVIESTKITPFACGVHPNQWEALSNEQKALYSCNEESRLQYPLAISLYRLIMKNASYAHSHKVMHFVMDINRTKPSVQLAMLSVMSQIKETLRKNNDPLADRIGGLTFEESHICDAPTSSRFDRI